MAKDGSGGDPKSDQNKDQYKDTLNLPQTDFPMRGSLPDREPAQIEKWIKADLYKKILENNQSTGKGRFLLHDGPPYANGDIHMGHALNKVLKDIVVKYKNLKGYVSEYIPGWDCHGLPIELGVEKKLRDAKRDKADVPITEFRKLCREYAEEYVALQKTQFQRLEVFGEWENPYRTMDSEYVASIVRELGRCAKSDTLYRGTKAVHWCPSCATALAEAEIEYADKKSPSIYVKFDLTDESLGDLSKVEAAAKKIGAKRTSFLIWTTTPWTIPSNMAIAVHPEFEYMALQVNLDSGPEVWIFAKELRDSVEEAAEIKGKTEILETFKGSELGDLEASHPFMGRKSKIIFGDHVTLEATGAVHTAPGHGQEDFEVGQKYGLEIFSPVDAKGHYTSEVPMLEGVYILKGNKLVIEMLEKSGNLAAKQEIQHSYPHCWRCHNPVIFRATPQWFIRVEEEKGDGEKRKSLRQNAIDQIENVNWIPSWGINRILGMVEARPDWCVSRQRAWGVPITVFYCSDCKTPLAHQEVFDHIAHEIESHGADVWFTESPENLLPKGSTCKNCGSDNFEKETDILDVWFDSGVSHAAVCERRELGWPADLYLEGSDQHRGWFQTSLLTGVATRGKAPFKACLTHGFVNDKHGKKMSKSKGNVTSPLELIKKNGAELLRLWVVFEDYRDDINYSDESIKRVTESYRRIRNTIRFLLGNLHDFDPESELVEVGELRDLDKWAYSRLSSFMKGSTESYDQYEFHTVFHQLINFFAVDLSAIYFDILKDRLYTSAKNSAERKSSQTVLYYILENVLKVIAPVLPFTAEEAWGLFKRRSDESAASVFLTHLPDPGTSSILDYEDPETDAKFERIWKVRDEVQKALEQARRDKTIGHQREAGVEISLPADDLKAFESTNEIADRLLLVSQVKLEASDKFAVKVIQASGEKCARCWVYRESVGESKTHPQICANCVEALEA